MNDFRVEGPDDPAQFLVQETQYHIIKRAGHVKRETPLFGWDIQCVVIRRDFQCVTALKRGVGHHHEV